MRPREDGPVPAYRIEERQRAALADMLGRVGAGDRAAFEHLYRDTSAKLFGVCLRILPERSQAEEALQGAYVSIWRRAGSYQPSRGTAMTWLISVARNSAIDRLRSSGRTATASLDLAVEIVDPAPDALATLEASDEARRLSVCLGELDPGDARLIRTAFLEGTSYPELATRASMPLGTIKSRIRRALLKLRACLQ